MRSGACCPNPGAPIRCARCRTQQRVHVIDCPSTPDMLWHERGVAFVCDQCWEPTGRPPIALEVRRAVIERDGMACRLCGRSVVLSILHRPDRLHLDHIKQWADGGEHSIDNLRVTCAKCNMTRKRRPVE